MAYTQRLARTAQARGTVGTGISAAGTVQADAQQLYDNINIITGTAQAAGVRLPGAGSIRCGDVTIVANNGPDSILIYPPVGGKVDTAAVNAAVALAPGRMCNFFCVSDAASGFAFIAD